jgi:uncharacterized membrane protein YedE/YeeE
MRSTASGVLTWFSGLRLLRQALLQVHFGQAVAHRGCNRRARTASRATEGADNIIWEPRRMAMFHPISALAGGALIGLASVLLMMLTGRIAGISGILTGCFALAGGEKPWRLAFVAGLIAAPLVSRLVGYPLPMPQMPMSWTIIVVAGFLVGLGARMGGGCTSGHGVCGIARLSSRSIVATVTFIGAAMVVVAIVRHGLGG